MSAVVTTIEKEKERERALGIIKNEKTREGLLRFARRLKDHEHLADLSVECYEKCIKEGMLHGNYTRLPQPLSEDVERVDLYRLWLHAVVITNTCSLPTINSVRGCGYLQAMLNQIDDIANIGGRGFTRLKYFDALEYSAEYLMRKYYSDKLRPEQKVAIDDILAENGIFLNVEE